MSSHGKGSSFERRTCKTLGEWWAGRDDIFWRSAGSGARAKVRGRSGKQTAGQHGDIAAIDPLGVAFIDAFTLELKKGYNHDTIHDVLDTPKGRRRPVLLDWVAQAVESHEHAGSLAWLVIHARDRRDPLVYTSFYGHRLLSQGVPSKKVERFSKAWSTILRGKWQICVFPMRELITCVSPNLLRQVLKTK